MGQNVEKGVAGHFHRLQKSRWEVQTCWIVQTMSRTKMQGILLNKFEISYPLIL